MKTKTFATISLLSTVALFVAGCSQTPTPTEQFDFSIANSTINQDLPSGSAMIINEGELIVSGDDSPWLFSVNPEFKIEKKSAIDNFPVNENNRIDHKTKPDFESMTMINYNNQPYYFVVGSGSKKELRENAYLIPVNGGDNIKLSLSGFYAQLHKSAGFTQDQKINIEAIANTDSNIFIFNRGNEGKNAIFEMTTSDMMNYLVGNTTTLPSLQVIQAQLPTINGVQAGFSGADYWQGTDSLIFTASVEGNNQSSVNDGAIQGSFVGVLPIDALDNQTNLDLTSYSQAIQQDGQALITKAESIAVDTQNGDQATGYIVSDNDNGTSQFFTFTIDQ